MLRVTLVQATPKPIQFIADIASICYGNETAKNPLALVKHLYENGHHSVFEHIWFTFKIEGISRACSHQLVRHRMCSFTQRSQRYCSEANFDFVTPKELESVAYGNHMKYVGDTYSSMVSMVSLKKMLDTSCRTLVVLTSIFPATSGSLSILRTRGYVKRLSGKSESLLLR